MDFTDKVVVITGASSGIGALAAEEFAKLSAKVVLVGRNATNLESVAAKCQDLNGVEPLVIQADVTKDDDVKRIAEDTLSKFERVDVLVNNAGAAQIETLLHPNLEVFDGNFNLNVRAAYHLTSLLAPALIESKGNIINISILASTSAKVWAVSYAMAKAALDHFTRLAANELASKGVRVNCINPGVTATNFQVTMFQDELLAHGFLGQLGSEIPLGQVCEAKDVVDMILYLASDAAKNITGAKIIIDGGLSVQA